MQSGEKAGRYFWKHHSTKQVILLFTSIIFLFGYFLLPMNRAWLTNTVVFYWHAFVKDRDNLDNEQRLTKRHGNSYTYSRQIAAFFNDKRAGDVLVLIPPADYFKEHGLDYRPPEPSVFYYFTDLRTISPYSSRAQQATWYVTADAGRFNIDRVTNKDSLQRIIAEFKKYPASL